MRIQRIAIIEFEVDRFLKFYDEYSNKLETILDTYKNIANKFKRYVAEYSLQMRNKNTPDEYAEKLLIMVTSVLNAGEINNIIPFTEILHKPLFIIDFENSTHALHEEILRFNHGGGRYYHGFTKPTILFFRKNFNVDKNASKLL